MRSYAYIAEQTAWGTLKKELVKIYLRYRCFRSRIWDQQNPLFSPGSLEYSLTQKIVRTPFFLRSPLKPSI